MPSEPTRRSLPAHPRRCAGELVLAACLPEDLDERPVGDALPVREATPRQGDRFVRQRRLELARKPRLADSGRPEDRDEAATSLGNGRLERGTQLRELPTPADERSIQAPFERRRTRDDS